MLRKAVSRLARAIVPRKKKNRPQPFRYTKPEPNKKSKRDIVTLYNSKSMRGAVHVLRADSSEHLHSHETVDGFWMVLGGKVRFHGEGGAILGEFKAMEGIVLPRDNLYWFERVGNDEAELLQVLNIDPKKGFRRENFEEPKLNWKEDVRKFDGRVNANN